ncbi:hypothetical protein TNCV_703291 [Trichonephila clavipes]|nr:hypothetical protein TNCV_703291 [Trichonephila clavipes]
MTKQQVNTQDYWVEFDHNQANEFGKSDLGFSDMVFCCWMAMRDRIATLGWERLHPPPPYSLNFAPSEFHLFLALKKNLTRRHIGSNADFKQAVKRFFRMQSP